MSAAVPGAAGPSFVFIVGTGRCGSTLLASMLSAHPAVHVPPETKYFRFFRPERVLGRPIGDEADARTWLERCRRSRFWADVAVDEERLARDAVAGTGDDGHLWRAMAEQWAEGTGSRVLGEQTPGHWREIERIRRTVPGARFVHLFRDPRDVALSARRIRMGVDHSGSIQRSGAAIARVLDAMERWRRRLGPDVVHEVRYEDLVVDPAAAIEGLCGWLGIDPDPRMLAHHEHGEAAYTERTHDWQALTREPVRTDRIGRYRTRMAPREVRAIEHLLGPRLARRGYEREPGPDPLGWRLVDAGHRAGWRLRDALGRAVAPVRPHPRGAEVAADGGMLPPV